MAHTRDTGDSGAGDSDDLDEFLANEELLAASGESFGYSIRRADNREILVPGFAPTRSVSVSGDLSHWAASAFLSHHAMGFPRAFDASAIDARNMLWNSERVLNLPLSQCLTGTTLGKLNPVSQYTSGVFAVAHLPENKDHGVLALEYQGGASNTAMLTSYAVDGSRRQEIGSLDDCFGSETLHPHQAGRWVLVSDHKTCRLLDLQNGTSTPLPLSYGHTWWPGSSMLFGCEVRDGVPILGTLDLASGDRQDIGPVEGGPADLDAFRWFPHDFAVSPSTEIACLSGIGPRREYQEEHGTRDRVHVLDVNTRSMAPLQEPFIDGSGRLERIHTSPMYVGQVDAPNFDLAESLTAGTRPLLPPDISINKELIWQDAHDLVIKALRSAVDEDGGPTNAAAISAVVPAALWAVRRENPDAFTQIAGWASKAASMASILRMGEDDQESASFQELSARVREAVDGFV